MHPQPGASDAIQGVLRPQHTNLQAKYSLVLHPQPGASDAIQGCILPVGLYASDVILLYFILSLSASDKIQGQNFVFCLSTNTTRTVFIVLIQFDSYLINIYIITISNDHNDQKDITMDIQF